MEYLIPLKNKDGDIVGHSKVDKEDYDKYIFGFWSMTRGYAAGKYGKSKGCLHRFILNLKKGDPVVDHINHDKLDNRKSNLRLATASQNAQNKSKTKNATSKYFGVSKHKNNWVCSLTSKDGKHIIKKFEIEEHAAYCYDILAIEHYGCDPQTNKIEKPENFEMVTEKENPVHTGVYKTKNGIYRVIVWHNKTRYDLGLYKTTEEAIRTYKDKYSELENNIVKNTPEIKRNCDGLAIIETFNKNKEKISECIVDDDKYYELIKFKWYNSLGYIKSHMNNTTVCIHRHLMNASKNDIIDHINNNPLDNRVSNLRICSATVNSHNKKAKTDGYRGVYLVKGNYSSRIIKDGIYYSIGTYITDIDAAKAYDIKARELYEDCASTNFKEIFEMPQTSYEHSKKNSSSKYRGVSIEKNGNYRSQCGVRCFLGTFKLEEDAARAYDKKAKELFGDKAKLNFP